MTSLWGPARLRKENNKWTELCCAPEIKTQSVDVKAGVQQEANQGYATLKLIRVTRSGP